MKINKCVLANGLRIVHTQDCSTSMVAMNIVYDVGARDENPEHTGFAHLFEHLMFGGSAHIPDYDGALQVAGGESNAWTSNDITNFYLTIPSHNAETAFWAESDRMLQLAFTPESLEVQRQVVIEEFKQRCLNQPYGDLGHILRPLVYKVHPYSWPVIGKMVHHIEEATMDEVKNFYYSYYAPNNAVMAVTGNITWEEVVRLSQKWFADIPQRTIPHRNLPQETEQTARRFKDAESKVPLDALYMAFHMGGRNDNDFYACDILSDILGNGRSCRLVQHLIQDKKVFTQIDAAILGSRDPGMFIVSGKPAKGVSLADAEDAVWNELHRLYSEPINETELEKVRNKFESTHIFESINYRDVATHLAWNELNTKAEDFNLDVDYYRAVQNDQLQTVASHMFRPENVSVVCYHGQH